MSDQNPSPSHPGPGADDPSPGAPGSASSSAADSPTEAAGKPVLGRNFNRLWLAAGTVTAGAAVTDVALPLVAVLTLDASAFAVGVLLACTQAAWPVIGLPAGAWVDRWSRRRVLVASQIGYAAVLATLPAAAVWGTVTLPHLYAVALSTGALMVFTNTARVAYLPAVVDKPALVAANSRLMATETGAGLAGNSVGGAVVQALGAPLALLIDAATSVAAALGIRSIPIEDRPAARPSRDLRAEMLEGLRYTFTNPAFRTLLLTASVFNAALAAHHALVIVLLSRTLALQPALIGVLLATSGVGGLIGAVATERLTRRWPSGVVWRGALLAGPAAGLLVPLTTPGPGLALFVAGALGLSVGAVVTNIVSASFRQALCPPHLLGRLSASSRVVAWGVIPLGALAGGGLGTLLGVRAGLWIVAIAFFAAPLFVRLSPLRAVDDLADLAGLAPDAASDESHRAGRGPLPPDDTADSH